MTEIFAASRLKVARAQKHIDELVAAIDAHTVAHPPQGEFTAATETEIARIAVRVKGLPPDVGPIIGDVIHNLRAVLDLMAVELVGLNGGNTNNVYFPFCNSAADLE